VNEYPVLGWDARRVFAGTLRAPAVDLSPIVVREAFEDIRHCSAARQRPLAAVTAARRSPDDQGVWLIKLDRDVAELRYATSYVLSNAFDPSGRYVCFVAPPHPAVTDMSLHVLDAEASTVSLLVRGTVARSCVPSWRDTSHVLFETVDLVIAETTLGGGEPRPLFPGSYASASPEGRRIAYRVGDSIRIVDAEGAVIDVSPRRAFWEGEYRGGMSWSPDGRRLLVSQIGGLTRHDIIFHVLDIETRTRTKVDVRYLRGLIFV